jgi:hypothetical protein
LNEGAQPGDGPLRRLIHKWREWIEETHSTGFELRRHFFRRFFDSDLVTTQGQWQVVAVGALAIVFSLALILAQEYFRKYRGLLELDTPELYQLAFLADHLFFVALSMVITGLVTALQWPSLFPGLRDYLALAGLPVRARQIFFAKFAALSGFVGLFIVAISALPSLVLPAVMAGRYFHNPGGKIAGLFLSMVLAGLFVFFMLVSLQGALLNLTPHRYFTRISLFVQGVLFVVLLGSIPAVLSIPGQYRSMKERPEWMGQAPPVWFLAVGQRMDGNREPIGELLQRRALASVGGAALLAVAAYVWSYRRHRVRALETQVQPYAGGGLLARVGSALAERSMPDPRERGVFTFVAATLGRSRQHRMALTAFVAIASAVVVHGFLSLVMQREFRGWEVKTFGLREAAISAPLALSLFVLAGYRYLFRLPVELSANWVFRINEGRNREVFLRAVDRFLLWWGVMPVVVLTLPLQVAMFGPVGGIAAAAMCLLPALVLHELLLFHFQRIPFTSAYLPGRRPLIETVLLYGVSVAVYVSILGAITVRCLEEPSYYLIEFGILMALWARIRKGRREDWQMGKLEFEEVAEPVVHTLSIEKD